MSVILLVFLGGGIGSVLRYAAGAAALRLFGPGFPWGTLFVNVTGGLAMGLLAALLASRAAGLHWPRFLITGVLGGFTTFSAFALDVTALWLDDRIALALAYALASVLLSVAACFAGIALGRSIGL